MSSEPDVVLELRQVSKQYPAADRLVLQELDLKICVGEFVAIVGPSGSGKSTLMNILGLLDSPTSGEVWLQGQQLAQLTETGRNQFRRDTLGFVLQSANMIEDESCLRNVALALQIQGCRPEDRWRRAHAALEQVGLAGYRNQRARTLSGGQKQRVAIARALSSGPQVLLADEPTGNLDADSANRVMTTLREATRNGVAVVLVTHDIERAALADRVLRLENGRLCDVSAQIGGSSNTQATAEILPGVNAKKSGAAEAQITVPNDAPFSRARVEEQVRRRRAFADLFYDALSSASLAPLRTVLLLLAFAVSVGGLIAARGIASTAEVQVAAQFAQAGNDRVQISYETGQLSDAEFKRLDEFQQRLSELDEVKQVAAYIAVKQAKVERLGVTSTGSIRVIAATPNLLDLYDASTQPAHLSHSFALSNNGALVSADLLREFHLPTAAASGPISPGYEIRISGRSVPVVGTFADTSIADGMSRTIVVPLEFLTGAEPSAATILAATTVGFPSMVGDASGVAMNPANPGMFTVQASGALESLQSRVGDDLAGLAAGVSVVLFLLLVVAGGAIMAVAVNARRSEIALRRILGASRRNIAALFIVDGALTGAAGGALGVGLGVAALKIIATSEGWVAVSDPQVLPLALVVGVIAGMVSAAIPAVWAAVQPPAIALRG